MLTRLAVCATLSVLPLNLLAADNPALKQGDRIVFFGDSITYAGDRPNGYITVFKNTLAVKHKELKVELINAGEAGHKLRELQNRLKRDVLDKKPNIVFIYGGINDVWASLEGEGKGTSKKDFEGSLKDLIARINASGAKTILCTLSVIGEKSDGTNKLDPMLEDYCALIRKVAEETKTPLCDLRKAFMDHLKANNKKNQEKDVLTTDHVHLNDAGNKIVAKAMLETLGMK